MSTPAPLEIRLLPVDQLIPAPYNPRVGLRPGSPAWRKLETSLKEFGLVEPLIWNESTGHVVGGHARLSILKSLEVQEVPVSVVHLTEAREKALNVVLNNHEAQGRFDSHQLADLLTELEALPELDLTGFDAADIRNLRFEPLSDLDEEPADCEAVEVTLTMSRETFAEAEAALDALVRQFDLVSHIRK